MVCGDCVKADEEVSPNEKMSPEGNDCPAGESSISSALVREDRGEFRFIIPGVIESDSQTTAAENVGPITGRMSMATNVSKERPRLACRLNLSLTFIWILLIGYGIQIGLLSWITFKMMTMPHTFAWKLLYLPLGSNYITSKLLLPYFPVLQIIVSLFVVSATVVFLKTKSKAFYLSTAKIGVWLQFTFSVVIIPISYAIWKFNKNLLKGRMTDSMTRVPESNTLQLQWEETQTTRQCCGLNGPKDWKGPKDSDGINFLPVSCFPMGLNGSTWEVGCYAKEYEILLTYGITHLVCLLAGIFFSGTLICILICRHNQTLYDGKIPDPLPCQKVEFRKGSSFISLNLNQKTTTVHLQGILLESSGTLASNISVLENVITIHIPNFKINSDNVIIERENQRIQLSVRRNKKIQGVCVITTSDETELEDVIVEDTKNGTLRISIPPSLI